jgi:hypothetical protein
MFSLRQRLEYCNVLAFEYQGVIWRCGTSILVKFAPLAPFPYVVISHSVECVLPASSSYPTNVT